MDLDAGRQLGLTPARAGTTQAMRAAASRSRAHPRTGGDHSELQTDEAGRAGSPPHGRGPQGPGPSEQGGVGLTPARAGTTRLETSWCAPIWAHPRTGGDHTVVNATISRREGSPPHGRGPLGDAGADDPHRGLTPARAGTTAAPATVRI